MIAIKSIIDSFTTEEQQQFINFLKKKNKRNDAKNITLFKLLVYDEYSSKSICKTLYKTEQSNAYHALRKRLFQSLIDFTANKNLEGENSIDMQIIKYILASRTFLIQKKYSIAYKILDKAEQLANEHLLFSILNEIYHTKIQYASYYPSVDLEYLILKQNENREKHQLEDKLNIVYSKLKSTLSAINHKGEAINFETTLNAILKKYNIQLSESLSFKSLYQILAIANISALLTTRYFEIEAFILKSYDILKSKKEYNTQLYYQIHITYIIANTLFRNKKFKASLQYIKEMEQLMLLKKGVYFKDFILKSTLIKALNFNFNNNQNNAITLIEGVIQKKHTDIESYLDLHLSLLMFYFQKENFLNAKYILSKFYHTDKWYIEKAGMDWVIKKNLAELLLYIELEEDDLFYSRLKSFKRRFTSYIKQIKQQRILLFLNFAEHYYKKPEIATTNNFKTKIEASFVWKTVNEEDIFVMSFYAWLKNKTEKGNLYNTTLKLLNPK